MIKWFHFPRNPFNFTYETPSPEEKKVFMALKFKINIEIICVMFSILAL